MRCPYDRCDGTGWLVDERTRTASQCRCMPEQQAARVAGNLRARIPREYQDASFQHTNVSGLPRDAVARVRRYVDTLDERLEAGDGLWISGSIGTGKTWLAMLVARYAIERGRAVAVYSVPRLLSEIRRTYDGDGTKTLDLLDQLTEVSLLVLDDVGTERTNPWVLEQLYTIINERWQERRAIVLTTNLDPMQMQDQIGERAVSRLVGMCETIVIHGADHRQPVPGGPAAAARLESAPPGREIGPAFRPAEQDRRAWEHVPIPDPRTGGPLGPPPPFDPGDHEAPRFHPEERSPRPAAQPNTSDVDPARRTGPSARPPRTFGADPADLRRPERRVFDERDH